MLISPAYAQAAEQAGGGSFLIQLLPLILIFVIFYFLLIRPQQKKMKQHREMVSALRRGDRVVLSAGIVGTVSKILDDDYAMVEVADGVRLRVVRSTIQDVLSKSEPVPAKRGKASDDEDEDEPETASEEAAEAPAPKRSRVPSKRTRKQS